MSEFATLLPADGDAYLRVQRVIDGAGGVHLDLHVDDVDRLARSAEGLGASVLRHAGYVVMQSPGGFVFCVVQHLGEQHRPPAVVSESGARSIVDQICIDVPASQFDRELEFWAGVTAWDVQAGRLSEFNPLVRPDHLPLRLLFQRLGADDAGTTARAHLDLSCGGDVDRVTEAHERAGAAVRRVATYWTTMVDPAGLEYCLTMRNPDLGTLDHA
jgi:hypothetical protein